MMMDTTRHTHATLLAPARRLMLALIRSLGVSQFLLTDNEAHADMERRADGSLVFSGKALPGYQSGMELEDLNFVHLAQCTRQSVQRPAPERMLQPVTQALLEVIQQGAPGRYRWQQGNQKVEVHLAEDGSMAFTGAVPSRYSAVVVRGPQDLGFVDLARLADQVATSLPAQEDQ